MPYLDENTFKNTCAVPMRKLGVEHTPPLDFWPYVQIIPAADFQGYDCSAGSVEWVWQTPDARYEHVLINTKEDKDVFMVIVLDVVQKQVFGHRLLDLKSEYGLRAETV